MTTTHDLPPLAGWRKGSDLAWRARIKGDSDAALAAEREARARDVEALDVAIGPAIDHPDGPANVDWAALRYSASSAAPLLLLPLEDALGLEQQPNLPGTTDEHPNWCRRMPVNAAAALAPAMDWVRQARAGMADAR